MATHLVTGAGSGIGAGRRRPPARARRRPGPAVARRRACRTTSRRRSPGAAPSSPTSPTPSAVEALAAAARPARLRGPRRRRRRPRPGRRPADRAPGSEQLDVNLVAPRAADPGRAAGAAGGPRHGRVRELRRRAARRARAGRRTPRRSTALRALADALRAEEREHGVRVTTVFPGRTATPMQREGARAGGQGVRRRRTGSTRDGRRDVPARARPPAPTRPSPR